MLYWSIQILVISMVLIALIHHLLLFFKQTLTVPKVKDLVNTTGPKYEKMYDVISSPKSNMSIYVPDTDTTKIDDIESMKNELRSYLKGNHTQQQEPEQLYKESDHLSFY